MNRSLKILLSLAVLLLVAGCGDRTDKADSGGVVLSISDFDGLPFQVSVTGAMTTGVVTIDEITIENLAVNQDIDESDLMNVEIETYEVSYTRNDSGTRVPVSMVRSLGGVVPISGNTVYENVPVLTVEQLDNPPLSELQAINGGFDRETGSEVIVMNLSLRFFGRTLGGNRVETNAFGFTVNFVP